MIIQCKKCGRYIADNREPQGGAVKSNEDGVDYPIHGSNNKGVCESCKT